ncbi:MAG: hypothetical protein JW776_06885 [Candidatus Lokiarchaeota archaeon]|nr:hypothetical protein [Candidatus Lokiarchaeota archaeon]
MKNNDIDGFDPFDFKDLDEMIERLFGNIANLPNLSDINPNMHHHSVSYRFGTGMDKPEIRINGELVDDKTLLDMVKGMKFDTNAIIRRNYNPTINLPVLDAKNVSINENPDNDIVNYEDTFFEVERDENSALLTIELPNVEKDQIILSQSGNKVTIIGENEYTAYKVDFNIDFNLDKTKTVIDGNNNIYQIKIVKE